MMNLLHAVPAQAGVEGSQPSLNPRSRGNSASPTLPGA
jgi:hypothetical protein